MASYSPALHLRQSPLRVSEAALLFVDCQNYNCHRSGAEYADGTGGHTVGSIARSLQPLMHSELAMSVDSLANLRKVA